MEENKTEIIEETNPAKNEKKDRNYVDFFSL